MILNYVLTLTVLLLFAGLGVDAGMLEWDYLQLSAAARASAISGALMQQRCSQSGYPTSLINSAGQATATLNGFTNGSNGVTVTIDNPPTAGPYSGNTYSVRSTITQSVTTAFMGLVGYPTMTLTAYYDQPGAAIVPLSSAFNTIAIYKDSAASSIPSSGGFDNTGNAFSADCLDPIRTSSNLGALLSWRGNLFYLGAPGGNNAVAYKGASAIVVSLTQAKFSQLLILASTAYGQPNYALASTTFTVTYTDNSTYSPSSPVTSATSDWVDATAYAETNEVTVDQTAYRIRNGASWYGTPLMYGYTINLNNSKTVKSLTLPSTWNLHVFAVDLIP